MHVLITCKFEKDRINSNGEKVVTSLVQGHSVSTFSNFLSLETARLIEAKFHVEPPLDGGTKVCSNGLGHTTNMAAGHIW